MQEWLNRIVLLLLARKNKLKINIDKDTVIILDKTANKEKILFSTKIKGQNGKIFLSTLELDKNQVDQIISELITLRSNLINNV